MPTDIKVTPPTELSEEAANSIIRLSGFFKKLRFVLNSSQKGQEESIALTSIVSAADIPELK